MSNHEHSITMRSDGLFWCDTCNLPTDYCDDESRCETGCVCNVGDPDLREEHEELYRGVYGPELERGEVTEAMLLAMALHSAKHALSEGEYDDEQRLLVSALDDATAYREVDSEARNGCFDCIRLHPDLCEDHAKLLAQGLNANQPAVDTP
jgi:hypothetical protein